MGTVVLLKVLKFEIDVALCMLLVLFNLSEKSDMEENKLQYLSMFACHSDRLCTAL